MIVKPFKKVTQYINSLTDQKLFELELTYLILVIIISSLIDFNIEVQILFGVMLYFSPYILYFIMLRFN